MRRLTQVDPDTLFYLIYAVAIAVGAVVAVVTSAVAGAITGALLGGALLTVRQWAFREHVAFGTCRGLSGIPNAAEPLQPS